MPRSAKAICPTTPMTRNGIDAPRPDAPTLIVGPAGLEDDIEEVEEEVFSSGRSNPVERIYYLKREVLEFRRAAHPLLAPIQQLATQPMPCVRPEVREYFRDVHDHARRTDELVNSQRELLTSVLEANLALVSVSQNEVVKKISAYAAVIAVPTFIASNYGMNFEHMPELGSPVGYPLALTVMAISVCILVYFFRRIDWL